MGRGGGTERFNSYYHNKLNPSPLFPFVGFVFHRNTNFLGGIKIKVNKNHKIQESANACQES